MHRNLSPTDAASRARMRSSATLDKRNGEAAGEESAPSSRGHRSCRVDEAGVADPDIEFVSFGIVRVPRAFIRIQTIDDIALDIIQRTVFNEQVHRHMALCIRPHEAARRCDVTKRRPVGSHFLSGVTEPQASQ